MKTRLIEFINRYGTRRTKRQKKVFREFMKAKAKDLSLDCTEQDFAYDRKQGTNLVVGSLAEADYVFLSSYDTHELVFSGKKLYYLDNSVLTLKNLRINLLKWLAISSVFFLTAFALTSFSLRFSSIAAQLIFAAGTLLAFVSAFLARGISSRTNCIQTLSLLLLADLMDQEKIREKSCFVFLDQDAYARLGLAQFIENNNLNRKYVIDIMNISQEGSIYLLGTHSHGSLIKSLKKDISNALIKELKNPFLSENLRDYVMIASAIEDESGLYIPHYSSREDTGFSESLFKEVHSAINKIVG